jgi:hypothetical protein
MVSIVSFRLLGRETSVVLGDESKEESMRLGGNTSLGAWAEVEWQVSGTRMKRVTATL